MSKYQALIDALNGDDSLFSNVRNGDVRALLADLERAEKDAERYRWLRDQDWFSSPLCVLRDPNRVLTRGIGLGADCPSGDRLDAAIDAALAQMAGG